MEGVDICQGHPSMAQLWKGANSPMAADYNFTDTHWSVVLQAQGDNATRAQAAMSQLCETYWFPLYAFARGKGMTPEDAEDATQGFFLRLLTKESIKRVQQQKGRLRSFFLKDFQFFMRDEWRKGQAQKRGDGAEFVPIDRDWAEGELRSEARVEAPSDTDFDRDWAITLLQSAFEQVSSEYEKGGKKERFDALQGMLTDGETDGSYEELGKRLGMTEGAVKSAVFRMRARYREVLEAKVAQTVETPQDISEELAYLQSVFS